MIKNELSHYRTQIPSCAYLPTDPHQRVIDIIPEQGKPMQSKARCPILVEFIVEYQGNLDRARPKNERDLTFINAAMNSRESKHDKRRGKLGLTPGEAYLESMKEYNLHRNLNHTRLHMSERYHTPRSGTSRS